MVKIKLYLLAAYSATVQECDATAANINYKSPVQTTAIAFLKIFI